MTTRIVESNIGKLVIVTSAEVIISDGQSALDFVANMVYEHDCYGIAVNKAAVADSFFVLSTGVAGEVVQKFVNYKMRFAIIGDFSSHTSKPLHDFIYESNKGRHLYFVADEDEAIMKLGE
ncbi:MAG: DUF4180 domain-containing protein [Oscillospiraceae bacterium]|nr:DUF4180 domain-containing protein [Oscillospiraceae bacterium]